MKPAWHTLDGMCAFAAAGCMNLYVGFGELHNLSRQVYKLLCM